MNGFRCFSSLGDNPEARQVFSYRCCCNVVNRPASANSFFKRVPMILSTVLPGSRMSVTSGTVKVSSSSFSVIAGSSLMIPPKTLPRAVASRSLTRSSFARKCCCARRNRRRSTCSLRESTAMSQLTFGDVKIVVSRASAAFWHRSRASRMTFDSGSPTTLPTNSATNPFTRPMASSLDQSDAKCAARTSS